MLLLVGWVARAGVVTRLLSAPVLTGYLAASAVVIVISQLTRVTGLEDRIGAEDFYLTVAEAVVAQKAPSAGQSTGPLPAGD